MWLSNPGGGGGASKMLCARRKKQEREQETFKRGGREQKKKKKGREGMLISIHQRKFLFLLLYLCISVSKFGDAKVICDLLASPLPLSPSSSLSLSLSPSSSLFPIRLKVSNQHPKKGGGEFSSHHHVFQHFNTIHKMHKALCIAKVGIPQHPTRYTVRWHIRLGCSSLNMSK